MFCILSDNSRERLKERVGKEGCLGDWQQWRILESSDVFSANSVLSLHLRHANYSSTLWKLSGEDEQKNKGIWSFMAEQVSNRGSRSNRRREYKLDAYVSDMMANKKWVLVCVSTRSRLPQPNENWLSIEKQWQIKWAIKWVLCQNDVSNFPGRGDI